MTDFTPWPAEDAKRYREKGYWLDLSLVDILQRQCRTNGDAVALICGERQLTYGQLDDQSDRLATALSRRGVSAGQNAVVQLPNVAEFYVVFFALLKLGVRPVFALFSHQRLELSRYVQQLQPHLLIVAAAHSAFADETFLAELREMSPVLQGCFVLGKSAYGESLADCLAEDFASPSVFCSTAPGEVAFYQLSGGSTGTPKLIPRTHNDYYYSIRCSAEICLLDASSCFLCALPAAHNFPLSSPGALGVFYAGGKVVLAPDPEPLRCFSLIEQHQVNLVALVPPAVILWLAAAAERGYQLASLRCLQVGGASFAEALARRVPEELGCQLQQVFGMAEGLVNYTRWDDQLERIVTTQGRPMSPDDEVLVVDEAGIPVAMGETGLLLTRGPYTFRGYFRAPEHNARVFTKQGFYATGDLVQRCQDGYLKVVGRLKDQINRGGEKIAAEEIENILLAHPAVVQVALVSVPDAQLGEKSCACLVTTEPGIRPAVLRQYLRAQGIAEFKLPDRFWITDTLPLTAVGKIDKANLRQQVLHSLPVFTASA